MRLGPKGRAVFTVKGWNDALRQAGQAAAGWWLVNYAPLRFKWQYAMSNLGYNPGDSKKRRIFKHGEPPYYSTGTMQNNLYMRSQTDVRAKGGGITGIRIKFPIGHMIKEGTISTFKRIPERERMSVAREFRRALILALQAQRAKAAEKARVKAERTARAAANKARRLERSLAAAQRRAARLKTAA